jgi:hypothetical protein
MLEYCLSFEYCATLPYHYPIVRHESPDLIDIVFTERITPRLEQADEFFGYGIRHVTDSFCSIEDWRGNNRTPREFD